MANEIAVDTAGKLEVVQAFEQLSGVALEAIVAGAPCRIDPTAGTISVNGSVIIAAKKVVDTTSTTAAALVMLDIDLSQLTGTSGSKTTLKTYVTGGNHASEIRPFLASDTIIVSVPYFESTKDALSARTMLVNATLNFDTSTGKLTGATVSIGNNVVTSTAVGTTAPVAIQ